MDIEPAAKANLNVLCAGSATKRNCPTATRAQDIIAEGGEALNCVYAARSPSSRLGIEGDC